MIMLKFEKVLSLRMFSLIILATSLFTSYSLAKDFSSIRPPLACTETEKESSLEERIDRLVARLRGNTTALIEALDDGYDEYVEKAVEALGEIDNPAPEVIQALKKTFVERNSSGVHKAATKVLEKLNVLTPELKVKAFIEFPSIERVNALNEIDYVIPEIASTLRRILEEAYDNGKLSLDKMAIEVLKKLNLLTAELQTRINIATNISNISELDKVCQITLELFPTPDPYASIPGEDRIDISYEGDTRISPSQAFKTIRLAISNLLCEDIDKQKEVIGFLRKIRTQLVEKEKILDNHLIEIMPEMAEMLRDPDTFMDALFIESTFFKLFSEQRVVARYKWYCLDYGSELSHGHCEANAITKTAFSIYRELFTDKDKLRAFVRRFAKTLKKDPSMVVRLDNEAKLYECFSKLSKRMFRSKIKCIVVDCDGVLWGGIIGEDGMKGIQLGEEGQGRHFLEFQKELLALKQKGFILAINTKNNPEDIRGDPDNVISGRMKRGVLGEHPSMVLKKKDFAVIKANWDDKASNLREIAKELNIGLDSILFLDDNPRERELVKQMCPEVSTPDLPADPAQYVDFIRNLDVLQKDIVTDEDRRRTEMYSAQREREELRARSASLETFYRSLDMKTIIRVGNENLDYIPRIAQLTQRTNQFNLTTKRYSEKNIKSFLENKDYIVYTLELSDKFGNAGIVGLIILHKSGISSYEIDTFCLSCRAVRLTVEDAFMASVTQDLKNTGVNVLYGVYMYTEQNALVKALYHRFGFQKVENLSEIYQPTQEVKITGYRWALDILQSDLKIPDWIAVTREERKNVPLEVKEEFQPIWDIFYRFLDIPENEITKELLIQRIDKWLSLLQENSINITVEEVEFLIRLVNSASSDIKKNRRKYLEEILSFDIEMLKRKVAPDVRNINPTDKPLYETSEIREDCTWIDDVCRRIFSDPYAIFSYGSHDVVIGASDNWLGQVWEYHVSYYKLSPLIPLSRIPSLVVTLHEMYKHKLNEKIDEDSALRFTSQWMSGFSPEGELWEYKTGTMALHLLHWKELLVDKAFIWSKL